MKPFVVKELKLMMKFLISIIIVIILQACTQKYQPIKTPPMENTEAKNNPYYSRTDTTKLMFPMKNGKNSLLRISTQSPEKQQQKELLQENTMNLMRQVNIIVPCAEITCSVPPQNFPAAVDGQVSLKRIKKESIM